MLSGLKANPAKSSIFCSGVSQQVKARTLENLQMEEGHFPVRYLGVPLISTKLTLADCSLLVEKVYSRFDSWMGDSN